MHIHRKQDLSIYYWLGNLFSDVSNLNVQDGYPVDGLVIPTISIEADTLFIRSFELGNDIITSIWYIDVFANNKTQRDEFMYRILDNIENGIPVYNYDEGFPPDASPSRTGTLLARYTEAKVIPIMADLVDKLYYRVRISFTTDYDEAA